MTEPLVATYRYRLVTEPHHGDLQTQMTEPLVATYRHRLVTEPPRGDLQTQTGDRATSWRPPLTDW